MPNSALDGPGAEHEVYTRAAWRDEVATQDTILGYWDWVYHVLEGVGMDDDTILDEHMPSWYKIDERDRH